MSYSMVANMTAAVTVWLTHLLYVLEDLYSKPEPAKTKHITATDCYRPPLQRLQLF